MSQWKIEVRDLVFKGRIGKGNFGEVYDGDYLGTRVAIKKLYFVNDELMQKYIEREMDTLTNLAHPNIVQFMGLCIELDDIYIVTEFGPGGDLRAILKDTAIEIPWDVRTDVIKQLAAAMNYLHSRNIIHRDLKSHNLLVGDGWKIKVCDFGLARPVDKGTKKEEQASQLMTIVGTNEWMAPEVMLGLEYDQKCDVFSYAMVMYEILTREKPPQRVVRDQFGFPGHEHKGEIPSETPEELWDLLCECAERDPEGRPEFKDIIRKIMIIQKKYDTEGWPETASQRKSKSRSSNTGGNGVKNEGVVVVNHDSNGKSEKERDKDKDKKTKKVKKVKDSSSKDKGEKKVKSSSKSKDSATKTSKDGTVKKSSTTKKKSSTTSSGEKKKVTKKKKSDKEPATK